mmetsp:Transcript_5612/g.5810  ORF Transcript_5612/g.5810 Transcript_5612/m.5810 type:complete len:318 (+) Transcript_5612:117-1070(+)
MMAMLHMILFIVSLKSTTGFAISYKSVLPRTQRICSKSFQLDMTSSLYDLSKVSLRVNDLKKSIDFYTKGLGMKVLNEAVGKSVLGYNGDGKSELCLELSVNDNTDNLSIGDGYKGIELKFPDIDPVVSSALSHGGDIIRKIDNYAYAASLIPEENDLATFPVRYGKISDPDGYLIKLVEKPSSCILSSVIVSVLDLDESVKYYSDTFRMTQIRRRSNVMAKPKEASMSAFMSHLPEGEGATIELLYKYGTDKIDYGTGFKQLSFSSGKDAALVMVSMIQSGVQPTVETNEENQQSVVITDPSGYKVSVDCLAMSNV